MPELAMRLRFIQKFFSQGERGNVAILTAIIAPLLFLVGGFAIDYGYASYIKQRLTQATDNAVLGSVSQSAATAGGGFGNTAWLQQYGTQLFKSNLADMPVSGVSFNLNVTSNGTGGVNSVGNFTYNYPTFFAGIIGIPSMNLGAQIKASANPPTYINYYVLVDVSQSMGIAASQSDMQNLYNRVVTYNNGSGGEQGCVFGCHVRAPGQSFTNEYLAHSVSPRINLRVDAAITAIQGIISDAQNASGLTKVIKIGLYTISRDPNNPGTYINTISSPSSDFTTLNTLAATIDLGGNNASGSGDTDFNNELSAFNNILPANGSGASSISPKNYVFLVTDGLSDASIGCGNCHPTSAFDPSQCTPIKLKSTLGVIYTTYYAIYNQNNASLGYESNYNALVVPYSNQIAPNLQTCATNSTYYFEAKDGSAINTAMKSLFATTLQQARLTQ